MSCLLRPPAELPLKLLALNNIGGSGVSLSVPVVIPQAILPIAAVPLERLLVRPSGPLAEFRGWRHGGINE